MISVVKYLFVSAILLNDVCIAPSIKQVVYYYKFMLCSKFEWSYLPNKTFLVAFVFVVCTAVSVNVNVTAGTFSSSKLGRVAASENARLSLLPGWTVCWTLGRTSGTNLFG